MSRISPFITALFLGFLGCSPPPVAGPSPNSSQGQKPVELFWADADATKLNVVCEGRILPLRFRTLEVNYSYLRKILLVQGKESGQLHTDTIILPVPLPEGGWEDYAIRQVSVMDPVLAAKYPEIKTYAGKSLVYPADNIRLDISPSGIKAMILSTRGTIMIDPYCNTDSLHVISFYKKDLPEGGKHDFEK